MEKYRAQTIWASRQKGVKKSHGLILGENDNLNNILKKYNISSWSMALRSYNLILLLVSFLQRTKHPRILGTGESRGLSFASNKAVERQHDEQWIQLMQ